MSGQLLGSEYHGRVYAARVKLSMGCSLNGQQVILAEVVRPAKALQ